MSHTERSDAKIGSGTDSEVLCPALHMQICGVYLLKALLNAMLHVLRLR